MPELGKRVVDAFSGHAVLVDGRGVVLDCNAPFRDLTGRALEDLRGRELATLGLPGDHARRREALGALLDRRAPMAALDIAAASGERRTLAFSICAVDPDDHDGSAVLLGVDVTSLVSAPAAVPLLDDRRIFAALVENSSDFIGIADPAGTPVYVNPAGRRMVGFAPDFPVGGTLIPEYYPADQHPLVNDEIIPAVLATGHWKGETKFRHWQTGDSIPVSDEHFVIRDPASQEVLGMGTITRDISDLRRAREDVEAANGRLAHANVEITRLYEKAMELDAAKTEFFANVSHELRTPLTLLLGPIESMFAEATEDRVRERLEQMHRNALRLLRLVDDLLDLARIEGGRLAGRYAPTPIGPFTAEIAGSFASAFEEAGLSFEVDCGGAEGTAWVDRGHWEKIVLNLVSNALKFTLEGGVVVRLARSGETFRLTVRDTGTGIPAEELPRVFERFHRVRGGRARSHEGAGIGLALARELAERHGGSIAIESEPGRGTELTVTLPAGRDHLPIEEVADASEGASTTRATRAHVEEARRWAPRAPQARAEAVARDAPTILVVDDSADMRAYLQDLLGSRYHVALAASGAEALAAARRERPDLVLSDVMMPGMSGNELVKALRKDAATRTLPVILLSARTGTTASVAGLDAGADDYVFKPFTAKELLARVRAHVTMSRARNALVEELGHANRELEAFVACASHDLRAPLRIIAGYAALLTDDHAPSLDEDGRRYLAHITTATIRMGALIDDLLTLSMTSKAIVERKPVDVTAIAERCIGELRERGPQRDVTARVAPGLTAHADVGLVGVVLTNLLGNAWKFTSLRPRATIEVGAVEAAGQRAFFVRDDGVGFDPAHSARLFEPFRRLQSDFEGTGVGLATVRRIVDRHGGRVWADGAPGRGATFFFTLGEAARQAGALTTSSNQ